MSIAAMKADAAQCNKRARSIWGVADPEPPRKYERASRFKYDWSDLADLLDAGKTQSEVMAIKGCSAGAFVRARRRLGR